MDQEKALVILKPSIPDEEFWKNVVISREYFKKIFLRVIRMKWFTISKQKTQKISQEDAILHYYEKREHPLFNNVIEYITSEVTDILSISWENSIKEVRELALAMRAKYIWNNSKLYNMIHASDSEYESEREHEIHFK